MRIIAAVLMAFAIAVPVQAQTLIYLENFSGGDGDWVDVDRNAVTYNATGGVSNGAYISMTDDIDTTSGGNFGGYINFRCAVAPSQLPSQNCSGGNFVGDYYFTEGVQELRFWFRHNSTKPGGLAPTIRVATPANTPGGSALFSAIPANTWTQFTVLIDPQWSGWDANWGSLVPSATAVLGNVGRLQPGYWIDPNDPVYTESNVTFDFDNVSIRGSTSISAEVGYQGYQGTDVMHPHHYGQFLNVGSLVDDPHRVIVYGQSTAAGDPVDLDTNDIVASTVRIGRLGGIQAGPAPVFGLDDDSDGEDDAEFGTLNSLADTTCEPAWAQSNDVPFRAELSTGEIVTGIDTTFTKDCDAQCHN